MSARIRTSDEYFNERFEHYRTNGEDWGTATQWARQDVQAQERKARRAREVREASRRASVLAQARAYRAQQNRKGN